MKLRVLLQIGLALAAGSAVQAEPGAATQAQALYKESQNLTNAKQYPQALSKLLAAAKLGNVDAMREAGIFLEDGTAGREDLEQAEAWYRKAAAKNDPEAMFRLAGILGIKNNTETKEVMALIERAADLGHMQAQRKISIAYYDGKGVPRDLTKAFKYECMAAEQGEPKSAYKAGRQLIEGEGIKKNFKEAARLLKISAKLKAEAALLLFQIFTSGGPGLQPDPVQALYYKQLYRQMTRASREDEKGMLQSLDRD